MNLKCLLCGIAILVCVGTVKAIDNVSERVSASISLKVPGNEAKQYPLTFQKTKNDKSAYQLEASERIPLTVYQTIEEKGGKSQITVYILQCSDTYCYLHWRMYILITVNKCQQGSAMMTASSTCPDSGIAVIFVLQSRLPRFILRIVGWCVKIG